MTTMDDVLRQQRRRRPGLPEAAPQDAGIAALAGAWDAATAPPPGPAGGPLPPPEPAPTATAPAAAPAAAPLGPAGGPVPAPVPADPPAAPAAPPAPPRKTRAQIDAELGLPPSATDLPPPPASDAGTWDVLSAAWTAETIRTDAWGETESRRRSLTEEMWSMLGEEGRARVTRARGANGWASLSGLIADEAGRQAATSTEAARLWAGYPLSADAFDQRITADRKADLEEAQAVLDQPGGGVAEFVGSSARAMTDATSLALMPFGVTGGFLRTVLAEAALGAAGEAAVLPREFRVAAELDQADPDPVSRIALGAALGGGLSAAVMGLGKGISALRARAAARKAEAELAPEGKASVEHEADIEEAHAAMTGETTPQDVLPGLAGGSRAEAPPGTLGDIVGRRPNTRATVRMDNAGATRNDPIDPVLETRLSEAVGAVYGPGYEVRVYSGGQEAAGQGGGRTGSTRHDHGRAADVHIFDPNGQQVTGDALGPLAQFWAANRWGGVGLEMSGGGIHLDIHETPPAGGGMAWNYAAEGGSYTPAQAAALEAGLRGELPPLRGTWSPTAPPGQVAMTEDAILSALIMAESSGNPNAAATTSGAVGLGQMTPATWMELIGRHRPDLMEGRSANEVLSLRADPALNREMTRAYLRENRAMLEGAGLPAGPGELYLAHFMGPTGATKALRAPLDAPIGSVMPRSHIEANASVRFNGKRFADFTVYDLRMWANAKMRQNGAGAPVSDGTPALGPTSRGYTGQGQVATADGSFRIDVDWEVVDAPSLQSASGDIQPRDRSRIASDAWIADTAARLDPAQLMPSPTADRGAPVVGPDSVIESGNGRFAAINRAYDRHPDRAAAYRGAIEAAGFAIPEGVERPVLIARRKTALSPEERSRFAIEAQDSGVALMTPTELARANSRAMTAPVLGQLDPAQPLRTEANAGFVRAALAGLPRSARNAMFDDAGLLNAFGERQLREAIFARAWPDPDIIARFAETDAGELKSLMEALERAAPGWAALKADIEAGLVAPDMDISAFVLDAMRLIATARDLSKRQGLTIATAVQELLDEVDLIEGAISPLTAALVRKFWVNGRAAKADDVAAFLTRYADDARKAGATGALFDAPTPRDVLVAIDPATFGDLPQDLGRARGFARPNADTPPPALSDLPEDAFTTGARSPEAEATHAEIEAELRGEIEATPAPATPARAAAASPAEALPPIDTAALALDQARRDLGAFAEVEINLPDGTTARAADILDDLEADRQFDAFLQACAISPEGAPA